MCTATAGAAIGGLRIGAQGDPARIASSGKASVKKQEVDAIPLVADAQSTLTTDEGQFPAELEQKRLEMAHERLLWDPAHRQNYVAEGGDVFFADRFRSILDRERPSQRFRVASISSASRFSSGRTRRYSRASTEFCSPSSA